MTKNLTAIHNDAHHIFQSGVRMHHSSKSTSDELLAVCMNSRRNTDSPNVSSIQQQLQMCASALQQIAGNLRLSGVVTHEESMSGSSTTMTSTTVTTSPTTSASSADARSHCKSGLFVSLVSCILIVN